MEEAEDMKQRHNELQRHSRAVLAAKLAARRRQKEEMNKEAALKKELKEMSKKQVSKFIFKGERYRALLYFFSFINFAHSKLRFTKFVL